MHSKEQHEATRTKLAIVLVVMLSLHQSYPDVALARKGTM
jgi:hypothetical protein